MARALLLVVLALAVDARAATTIRVHAGESIQAAVDRAPAGARILVEPGVYHEAGAVRAVTVTQEDIHLIGLGRRNRPVVLEQAGGQTQGIWVSPTDTLAPADVELPPCGVSGARIHRFDVRGFTVRGFAGFGIYLACVDDFRIEKNVAEADRKYSMFPVASRHGRMSRNVASGTNSDACIYVGQDEDVLVDRNHASDCLIGLQIENAVHVRMRDNVAEGNTAGAIIDIIDRRQTKVASDNEFVRNVVRENNRPNNAPPDVDTSQIVPGIGIILNGADKTLIARNRITDNHLAGMTLLNFCFGMPQECRMPGFDIDPKPDGNRVVGNRFSGNGVDVIYDPQGGQGNCFARNHPATLTGGPLPSCD